jgi:hypothetical protein
MVTFKEMRVIECDLRKRAHEERIFHRKSRNQRKESRNEHEVRPSHGHIPQNARAESNGEGITQIETTAEKL